MIGHPGYFARICASDAPARQRAALDLLKQLYEQGRGVVSTQVLQEYCNVA